MLMCDFVFGRKRSIYLPNINAAGCGKKSFPPLPRFPFPAMNFIDEKEQR